MSYPVDCFKALGDIARFNIFMAIVQHPGKDRAYYTKWLKNKTSAWHHLQVLIQAELIYQDTIDAKDVRYYPNKDTIVLIGCFFRGIE